MNKRAEYKTKDTREVAYYVENCVMPHKLEGYKGLLYATFYQDEIIDMRENWYIACQEWQEQRKKYNANKNRQ